MKRSIPTINTARLTLCGMRPEDFDRFAEIWADPGVVRHISGEPLSRAEAWDRYLRNAGHWQMTGFGQWAIVQQSTRRMIGQTGFFNRMRALGDDFDSCPEAGWVIATEAQGHGLGLEAAMAAHDWFDRVIPGPLVAMVGSDNKTSLKMAVRLGYTEMRGIDFEGDPVLLLRREKPPTLV